MGKGQKERARATAAAEELAGPADCSPKAPTLGDFLSFPSLGTVGCVPTPQQSGPLIPEASGQAGSVRPVPPAMQAVSSLPAYMVLGSKKGGFPVSIESRAKGKKVTVIHNVSGDVSLLLSDLKSAVGSGGVVRDVLANISNI